MICIARSYLPMCSKSREIGHTVLVLWDFSQMGTEVYKVIVDIWAGELACVECCFRWANIMEINLPLLNVIRLFVQGAAYVDIWYYMHTMHGSSRRISSVAVVSILPAFMLIVFRVDVHVIVPLSCTQAWRLLVFSLLVASQLAVASN
jgi:hypothetical protein